MQTSCAIFIWEFWRFPDRPQHTCDLPIANPSHRLLILISLAANDTICTQHLIIQELIIYTLLKIPIDTQPHLWMLIGVRIGKRWNLTASKHLSELRIHVFLKSLQNSYREYLCDIPCRVTWVIFNNTFNLVIINNNNNSTGTFP